MEYVIIIFLTLAINVFVTVMYSRRLMKRNDLRKAKEDRLKKLRKFLAAFLLRSNDPNGKDEVKQNLCSILVHLDMNDEGNMELYKLIKDYLEFIKNNDSDENKVEEIVKQGNKVFNAEPSARM